MSGRGRGRGISNAPAWMTRGMGGGGGGPSSDYGPYPPQQQRDDFGRNEPPFRGSPGSGGYPDRDRYNNNNSSSGVPPPLQGGGDNDNFYRGPPPRGGPPHGRDGDFHRQQQFRGGGGGPRGGGGGDYDHSRSHRGGPPNRGGGPPSRRGGGGGGGGRPINTSNTITFRSYQEEREWVEERRQKRLARPSKFDVPPTPEQAAVDAQMLAMMSNPAATDFAGINPMDRNFNAVPQQTRHARRLYIGQLPPDVTEEELHVFFRNAIERALEDTSFKLDDDPILSVYINHERRFCFLEFKTVEMTTAGLALDGIDLQGKGKVKVKRPNDYNPTMAPQVHPSAIPPLDVSKLGIISGTVPDGPNKIFIGGLHYHLSEDQILELLQAFGQVKSFHLVKNDPDSSTSKGYAFCEFADPNVTPIAVMGLNGMDLGGGKVLTARVAGERSTAYLISLVPGLVSPPTTATPITAPPNMLLPNVPPLFGSIDPQNPPPPPPPPQLAPIHQPIFTPLPVPTIQQPLLQGSLSSANTAGGSIIAGFDVEALIDAAMGLRPMPTAPTHLDEIGLPLTRFGAAFSTTGVPAPILDHGTTNGERLSMTTPTTTAPPLGQMPSYTVASANPNSATNMPVLSQQLAPIAPPAMGPSALEIANAALDAAFGASTSALQQQPQQQFLPQQQQQSVASNGAMDYAPNPGVVPTGGGALPPPGLVSTTSLPPTSRILVLHNMVTEQDLSTDEDYQALMQEVREECSKYGTLINMIIPRQNDSSYSLTAVGKIFLEYAQVSDALQAQSELQGRQFGSSIVETSFLAEDDYAAGRIK